MATVNITSTKSGEIERFLSKFYNTRIDLDDKFKWSHIYQNPIEIAEIIGTFIDNSDDYFLTMWVCLDKNIYINVTENNADMIIKYIYERYPYSNIIVTGPSFIKLTSICAPNIPFWTSMLFSSHFLQKYSYSSSAYSGLAASIKDGLLPSLQLPYNVN